MGLCCIAFFILRHDPSIVSTWLVYHDRCCVLSKVCSRKQFHGVVLNSVYVRDYIYQFMCDQPNLHLCDEPTQCDTLN